MLAKGDADVCAVRPALDSPDVEIWTDAFVSRITTDPSGVRATGVESSSGVANGFEVEADFVVVACGAVNSAALLLRSATDRHPHGLANSSGLVGRNYMVHTNSVLVAIDPRRPNPTVFQKTISVNDFYHAGIDPEFPFPDGESAAGWQAARRDDARRGAIRS